MALEFTLSATHATGVQRRGRNPFTGEEIELETHALKRGELDRLHTVLARWGATDDGEGRMLLRLSDGSRADVVVGGAAKPWTVSARTASEEAARLVFEIVHAGGFVAQFDDGSFVTTEDARSRVADREPDCLVVDSARSLSVLLLQGRDAWREHVRQLNSN